jgi:hypothetical protein
MSTKSREVIWGGRIMGANIRAQGAREAAKKTAKEADRAEAEAWSIRMEGYGGPAGTDDWAMPQRRLGLARGRMQSLQARASLPPRCYPPPAGHADLEA